MFTQGKSAVIIPSSIISDYIQRRATLQTTSGGLILNIYDKKKKQPIKSLDSHS